MKLTLDITVLLEHTGKSMTGVTCREEHNHSLGRVLHLVMWSWNFLVCILHVASFIFICIHVKLSGLVGRFLMTEELLIDRGVVAS